MDQEHHDILYHYYFDGLPEPVTILAASKSQGRAGLLEFISGNSKYTLADVRQESCSRPIVGITTLRINNIPHVWVGRRIIPTGWMPKTTYDNRPTNNQPQPRA